MGKKTLFSWLSTVTGPWEQAWVITLSLVAQLLLSASERAKYFIRLHMQGPRQGNNTPYLFCFFFAGQIPFIGTFSFLARALQPFLHGICRADVLENCLFALSSPTFLLFSAYLLPLPTIRPFLAETESQPWTVFTPMKHLQRLQFSRGATESVERRLEHPEGRVKR